MYAMSDLYVMPSVSEPFGIAPFEALLYDVPVIISKQSGAAEVLKNAVQVDFWDVNRLAEWMIHFLKNGKTCRQITQACLRELKTIEWSKSAGKLKDIYGEMLKAA